MNNQENKEVVLMKNNIITKAKFNITTVENRVFQLVMYKLQKKGMGVLECQITLDEFKTIIKNKNQVTAEGISEILVELRKQSIFFKRTKQEQSEAKKSKKPFSIWGEWGIINGHEYDEETQTFTIEASEKVHSLLHEYMQEGYTPINLSVFFSLSNSYAQRFYDLLRLWTNSKKVINYTLDELRELLMIEGKYPRYVDLKRRVVVPAINELNSTGMFNIEIQEKRQGRAVTSLDFIVEDRDKRKYFEKASVVVEEKQSAEMVEEIVEVKPVETESFIPEETVLIKPLHRLVKTQFKGINFNEGIYYNIFLESEVATQIQDNVEEIGLKEWPYFRATLQNKLEALQQEEQEQEKERTLEEQLLGWTN